jgi:hypothetical protein
VIAVAGTRLLFVDTVPPQALTHARMHMMKRRILRFATAYGVLPNTIDELPRIEGFDNGVKDGWGRPILWRIEAEKVILTSYGRDGVPGGVGEDTDLVATFLPKTTTGAWADELCDWEIDPYGRGGK